MTEPYRVGDAERAAAVHALAAHRDAGRLTPQEYEDRSVRAGNARTSADLALLFDDLPSNGDAPGGGVLPERWAPVVVGISPFVALAGFMVTNGSWPYAWIWFLLVPAAGVVAYGGRGRRR